MGNAVRGTVDFESAGIKYTLQFTANAMCELEDAARCSTMAFLQRLQEKSAVGDLSIGDVRLLFWAGLLEHHPDVTVKQAGALMQDLGGIGPVMSLTQVAVQGAMPASGNVDSAGSGSVDAGVSSKKKTKRVK